MTNNPRKTDILIANLFSENIKLKTVQKTLTDILLEKGVIDEEELKRRYIDAIRNIDMEKVLQESLGVENVDIEKMIEEAKENQK